MQRSYPTETGHNAHLRWTLTTIMVYHHNQQPLHDLDEVQYLVREDAWTYATPRCRKTVQSLGLTRRLVATALLALTKEDHRSSYGPADSEFGQLLVDDYVLWFDEDEQRRCERRSGTCFYIKFGVHSSDEGLLCAVVSFHVDSRP